MTAREGLSIGKGEWTVGKLLGSGVCAQVFECRREREPRRADASCSSSMSFVAKIAEVPVAATGKKAKAAKEQKAYADTLYAEHLLYTTVLQRAPRSFPLKAGYGESAGLRFLVLQRLGRSLGQEIKERGALPAARLGRVGLDLLTALEVLHTAGYAYVDMKPENIMLGRWEAGRVVGQDEARLVDFGVTVRYVSATTGEHREAVKSGGLVAGTPRFAGVAAHRDGTPPCRRDDVEGLAHVLICAAQNRLPWDGQDEAGTLRTKIACADSAETMRRCKGLSAATAAPLGEFLKLARATPYTAKPDYAALRTALNRLLKVKEAAKSSSRATTVIIDDDVMEVIDDSDVEMEEEEEEEEERQIPAPKKKAAAPQSGRRKRAEVATSKAPALLIISDDDVETPRTAPRRSRRLVSSSSSSMNASTPTPSKSPTKKKRKSPAAPAAAPTKKSPAKKRSPNKMSRDYLLAKARGLRD